MVMTIITVLLALASIVSIILVSILICTEIRERLSTENAVGGKHETAVNYIEKAKVRSPLVAQPPGGDMVTADDSSDVDLERFWMKKEEEK